MPFRFVPFRGSAPALQQVLGGQLDITIDQAIAPSRREAGDVSAYAVTASKRLGGRAGHPDHRRGGLPGFYVSIWHGALGAEGHAEGHHREAQRRDCRTRSPIRPCRSGSPISARSFPARSRRRRKAFGAFHKAEMEKWTPIIKAANIKPEG